MPQKWRHDLWNDGVANGLDERRSGGRDGFDRPRIDVLDFLGEQLAQCGHGMNGQGDHGRK